MIHAWADGGNIVAECKLLCRLESGAIRCRYRINRPKANGGQLWPTGGYWWGCFPESDSTGRQIRHIYGPQIGGRNIKSVNAKEVLVKLDAIGSRATGNGKRRG